MRKIDNRNGTYSYLYTTKEKTTLRHLYNLYRYHSQVKLLLDVLVRCNPHFPTDGDVKRFNDTMYRVRETNAVERQRCYDMIHLITGDDKKAIEDMLAQIKEL